MNWFDDAIYMGAASNTIDRDDRLRAAIEELTVERRRTADELEAFQTFEEQIRAIPTAEADFETGQPAAVAATTAAPKTGLQRVQVTYESTIMSVPHYLGEYDDTYIESLVAEFSPEIAAALTDSGKFNNQCKRVVLSATSNAQATRETLLDAIDRENDSIREAKAELDALLKECEEIRQMEFIDNGFGALDAYRTRVETLTEKCRVLSARRQDAIFDQRRIQQLPADVPDVTVYFYQRLAVDYPVMSLIAELLEIFSDCKKQIERAMTNCHA